MFLSKAVPLSCTFIRNQDPSCHALNSLFVSQTFPVYIYKSIGVVKKGEKTKTALLNLLSFPSNYNI